MLAINDNQKEQIACSKCGLVGKKGIKYCNDCGHELGKMFKREENLDCRECNASNPAHLKVCLSCHEPLHQDFEVYSEAEDVQK